MKLLEEQLAEEKAKREELEGHLKRERSIREEPGKEKRNIELELHNVNRQVPCSIPSSFARNGNSLLKAIRILCVLPFSLHRKIG